MDSRDPRLTWLAAGGTLLVPTRRLAFHLQARFDAASLRDGRSTWPTPVLVTWEELAEVAFRRTRDRESAPERWLPRHASRLVWDEIIRSDPETSGLVSPAGLASRAERSWRLLHEYLIPYDALDGLQTPEQLAFARWATTYRQRLQQSGWVDEATATRTLDWKWMPSTPLAMSGFDELTPRQQRWLDAIREGGHDVAVIAGGERARVVLRRDCADAADEFDRAARWAAQWLDAEPQARLAVIVTDLSGQRDEVRRCFDRVFEPATGVTGGPRPGSRRYSFAATRMLSSWPIVSTALECLDLFTVTERGSATRLLRMSQLDGAVAEGPSRAELEQRLARRRGSAADLHQLQAALIATGNCPILASRLGAALALSSGWPRTAPPSEWTVQFSRLLLALGWAVATLDSVEHQTRERWLELLAELGACDIVTGAVSRQRAAQLLRALADDAPFEPEEAPAPLVVIDPQTSAGMRFDALWVSGLDATRWPPPAAPDPFLPMTWQLRRRVPGASAEICSRSARATFDRLCRSAAHVVVSHAQTERDAELLPSPLLANMAQADPRTETPERVEWAVPSLTRVLFDARPELDSRPEPRFPALAIGSTAPGGAALLLHQAACPFRAQARLRLRAEPLETAAEVIDATVRGQLLHDVLARVWATLRTSSALRECDPTSVEDIVERAIAGAMERLAAPLDAVATRLLELESQWLHARVLDVLELDRARPPFAVIARETPHELELGDLRLELRIDRVDQLASGAHAIIDYKTSRDVQLRHWAGERPQAPQLPAYVLAFGAQRVAAAAFGAVSAGSTRYIGLTRDPAGFPELDVLGAARGSVAEFTDWESMLETWRQRLGVLAGEFREGEATLARDPATACQYCHLHALCRIDAAERDDDDAPPAGPFDDD